MVPPPPLFLLGAAFFPFLWVVLPRFSCCVGLLGLLLLGWCSLHPLGWCSFFGDPSPQRRHRKAAPPNGVRGGKAPLLTRRREGSSTTQKERGTSPPLLLVSSDWAGRPSNPSLRSPPPFGWCCLPPLPLGCAAVHFLNEMKWHYT